MFRLWYPQAVKSLIYGKKRITCLSPRLVRLEYAPDGNFENRRSMVAYREKNPLPLEAVVRTPAGIEASTGGMTLLLGDPESAFYPSNTEIRWTRDDLLHYWRPGDRDHRNLGGTVHSLDQLSGRSALGGRVHVADMESPDLKANAWQDGDFAWGMSPYYRTGSGPEMERRVRRGDRHIRAQHEPELFVGRSLNILLDQYLYSPGILSQSGYFLLNDSDGAVLDAADNPVPRSRPGYQDWYFFAYGWDYRAALSDFRLLSGSTPMPPAQLLGIMSCRWPAYSEAEAMELVARYQKEGMALSSLVIDMEWHRAGWHNWEWNEEYYPDPARFAAWARRHNLLVGLNVHPQQIRSDDSHFARFVQAVGDRVEPHAVEGADGCFDAVSVNMADAAQAQALMDVCAEEGRKFGIDFWWIDGSHAVQNSSTNDQLITNKWFYEHSDSANHRGMLLSRYGGLGSHRYGAYFTGDTHSEWGVLAKLCEFTIRAGHVGVAYVSHDTGGFTHPDAPIIDPILYIRWLQFAAFSPVFRFHSAPGGGSRAPWDYGPTNLSIARRRLRHRNRLLPYLYTAARQCYERGLPLVRGVFLSEPRNAAAYRFDQFLLGDDLLVAPILAPDEDRTVYLPQGSWLRFDSGETYPGGREITVSCSLAEYPVFVRVGSVIPLYPGRSFPDSGAATTVPLTLFVVPGTASGELYEDDGRTSDYVGDSYAKTLFRLEELDGGWSLLVDQRGGSWEPQPRELTLVVPSYVALAGSGKRRGSDRVGSANGGQPYRVVRLGIQCLHKGFEISFVDART